MDFHKVKISNQDPSGMPMGTVVELDGKPVSGVREVGFHQGLHDFTVVSMTLIGHIDFVSEGAHVIFITEDGRKFRVIEEVS